MKTRGLLLFCCLLPCFAHADVHTYDSSGRLARTTDATGNSVVYRYDAAGNLTSVATERDVFVPAIATQPVDQAAVAGQTVTFRVTATQATGIGFQWQKDGANIAGATSATLTLATVAAANAGAYRVVLSSPLGSTASVAARLVVGAATAPAISTPPIDQTIVAGGAVRLEVTASGAPAPTYQWTRNGTPVAGATGASLTIATAQGADAGTYAVVVSNSAGTVTSAPAALTVTTPAAAPRFTTQPASVTVAFDSTVVLRAEAADASTYQWRRDGVAIAGATGSTLVLAQMDAARTGSYTVESANALGRTVSAAASVGVSTASDFGRVINLSILAGVSAGEPSFRVGTVLGGRGTKGTKPVVIRAAGPSLAPLGVSGVLADPRLDITSGGTAVANNDNWGGGSALAAAMAQVGAFPFSGTTSRDAAISRSFAAGDYVIEIGGVSGATGAVIAELYDATAPGAQGVATPRLVNVSVLKQIAAAGPLTTGFVVGGGNAKTVLIRAVGPSLAVFGVSGVMPDPRLALYAGASVIAANDNWGGDPQLAAIAASVGAFALGGAGSRDAMLVATLPPGSYTAQVTAADGQAGLALVEVYEVP